MGEVVVGDQLLGADGRPTRVVAATEVMIGRPCYEVEFSDGTVIIADAEHQWRTTARQSSVGRSVATGTASAAPAPGQRAAIATAVRVTTSESGPAVVTTAQLHHDVIAGRCAHIVAAPKPVQLPTAVLPLPPYLLGAWLADPDSDGVSITCADPAVLAQIAAEGVTVTRVSGALRYRLQLPVPAAPERCCVVCGTAFVAGRPRARTCSRSCWHRLRVRPVAPMPSGCPECGARTSGGRRCRACHFERGTVQARLRGLGVLGDKHIPSPYLRADVEQRRALLRGLVDISGAGDVHTGTNRRLAENVRELAATLGARAVVRTEIVGGRPYFAVEIGTGESAERSVVAVRPVPSVPVRCVQVDNDDHLYLAGPDAGADAQLDPRPGLRPLGGDQEPEADGHLLPGDGQARDHDAAVLGRGRRWRCRTCAPAT